MSSSIRNVEDPGRFFEERARIAAVAYQVFIARPGYRRRGARNVYKGVCRGVEVRHP